MGTFLSYPNYNIYFYIQILGFYDRLYSASCHDREKIAFQQKGIIFYSC